MRLQPPIQHLNLKIVATKNYGRHGGHSTPNSRGRCLLCAHRFSTSSEYPFESRQSDRYSTFLGRSGVRLVGVGLGPSTIPSNLNFLRSAVEKSVIGSISDLTGICLVLLYFPTPRNMNFIMCCWSKAINQIAVRYLSLRSGDYSKIYKLPYPPIKCELPIWFCS